VSAATGSGRVSRSTLSWSVPDDDRSLADGAIAPWSGSGAATSKRVLGAIADEYGFDVDKPWKRLRKRDRTAVLFGTGLAHRPRPVPQPLRTPTVVRHALRRVVPWLERRHSEAESGPLPRAHRGLTCAVPCPVAAARVCDRRRCGHRREPESLRAGRASRSPSRGLLGELTLSERIGSSPRQVLKEVTRAAPLPLRRRARLPELETGRRAPWPVGRRSGSDSRPRSAEASSASSTCSTSPRWGCISATTSGSSTTWCASASWYTVIVVEHDEETIRIAGLRRGHRSGAGSTAARSSSPAGRRRPGRAPLDHRPVPSGSAPSRSRSVDGRPVMPG